MTGNKNLVLIGMPGSGKSTVGVLCAKALGMPFLDTDLAIQQKTGKLLQKSVDELGAEGFLAMEEQVIISLDCENTVLATGGSVALEDNAMAHLRERGVVTWSTDGFFRETREKVEYRKSEGCSVVERECSALAACASFRKATWGMILYTADCLANVDQYDERNWGGNAYEYALALCLDAVLAISIPIHGGAAPQKRLL